MNKTLIGLALFSILLGSGAAKASEPAFIKTSVSSAFETDFTSAAEKTVNAVVCIKSFSSRQQNPYGAQGGYDPFGMFDFFFGNPGGQQRQQPRQQQKKKSEPVQTGLGSGVIITEDGYIVTNNHVIDNADKLEVLLNDNSTYEARIIGTDEASDLALIKIDAKGLSPIVFGDSESVKVGEWVLAVGNPFGFNSTVTAGIVSAKARSLSTNNKGGNMSIESFIQTDAALNPGNSGGALVNLNGELIGINSAIYSNTGSYSGFSFAIPTTIVKKVMADIRQYGTVQRAMLGCSVVELDAKLAKEKGITAAKAGCLVASVSDMSTAKEMGLEEDDLITAINGTEVHNFAQLVEQINKFRPGDKITVTYYRNNKEYSKTGTLRNSQGNTAITKKGDFSELGCAFMKISAETKQHLGISNGVQIQGLKNGVFKDAGVKDGFIITEINDTPVNSTDDVEYIYNQIMKSGNDERVMFLKGVYPTGKKYYYAVNLENAD
ncbi:MAG: Do family serine endopeptidase [Bacteroidales bacterium]|nr:Do family serine endopeptidase [Bacteroidales bacterium]MBD5223611.1 Do family serine endopeptidase [Bacteroidales bacterium]MBD5302086.1 Do family serine endopeptidase [Bacteroides sp.]MBD5348383.1 Do family serine endopeptidase [Bacteroides sp.]